MQLALNSQLFGRMRTRGGPGLSDHNEIVPPVPRKLVRK